jgi:uncharacterized protein (DUF2147 family)
MQISRSRIFAMLIGGAAALGFATGAVAAEPSAVGLWQKLEDGKPVVWILIVEREGVFEGAFAKFFPKPGEKPYVDCSECKDDRKDKPMLGLSFIRDMKRKGLKYEDGNILDPRDGKVYNSTMEVKDDGRTLDVSGCFWIVCKAETWSRLPDSQIATLDPAVLAQYMPQIAQRTPAPKAPPANQKPKPTSKP